MAILLNPTRGVADFSFVRDCLLREKMDEMYAKLTYHRLWRNLKPGVPASSENYHIFTQIKPKCETIDKIAFFYMLNLAYKGWVIFKDRWENPKNLYEWFEPVKMTRKCVKCEKLLYFVYDDTCNACDHLFKN